MNAPILSFTPQTELEPLANLEVFVKLCRSSEVLSASMQFDKNVWDVGYTKGQNKATRAVFSTLVSTAI